MTGRSIKKPSRPIIPAAWCPGEPKGWVPQREGAQLQRDISDQLRAAAMAAYGDRIVAQPAMEAALANLAAALDRIRREPLAPTDPGPSGNG